MVFYSRYLYTCISVSKQLYPYAVPDIKFLAGMRGEDPQQHELHVCKSKTVEIERIVESAEHPAHKYTEKREDEERCDFPGSAQFSPFFCSILVTALKSLTFYILRHTLH